MTIFVVAVLMSYDNYEYKPTLRDFGEAKISTKSVDSNSVSVEAPGDRPCRFPLNPSLSIVPHNIVIFSSPQCQVIHKCIGVTPFNCAQQIADSN
jgi:hypothetical protein